MKICLHQLIRPSIHIPMQDVGDCRVCVLDDKNQQCRRYYPINVVFFEVEKKREV